MKGILIMFLLSTWCFLSQSSPVDYDDYYDDYDDDGAVEQFDQNDSECEDDDIFGDCESEPIKPSSNLACFKNVNEIDNSIFDYDGTDTRQAPTLEVCRDSNPGTTCQDYKDDGFVCAPSWTCNNTIITDGEGLIDVRSNGLDIPGECVTRQGTLDSTDRKCPNEGDVCCKNPDLSKKSNKEPCREELHYSECGRSLEAGLKISGGDFDNMKFAQPGEFPHMCIIYKEVSGTREYVGGASLIARNKLLTVAHKFWLTKKGQKDVNDYNNPGKFVVRCGENNVRNEAELLPYQETKVKKIHIHPDYLPRRVKNNMAIIETVNNFVYQKHIGRVCLPGVDSSVYEGKTECWSSGWGADTYSSSDNTKYSDNLKKIKMPVVSLRTCQNKLRQHPRLKSTFKVHKSWLCVGGEAGVDTCSGDGGSPHVCKGDKGEIVQVGAVNWGLGCGEAVPSVYSSVPDSMCWIDYVMSCVSDSTDDIDISNADYDIRGAFNTPKSVNKLSKNDCTKWFREHDGALDEYECSVEYSSTEQFDERFGGGDQDEDEDEDSQRGR